MVYSREPHRGVFDIRRARTRRECAIDAYPSRDFSGNSMTQLDKPWAAFFQI